MADTSEMTVTLHWYCDGALQRLPMTCDDQLPDELIAHIVAELGLATVGGSNEQLEYELLLEGEQRPPLKPTELLSIQGVHDGSRLYLLIRRDHTAALPRCILQLSDGTEIVVPRGGQELRRAWLLEFVELHHPESYRHEIERMVQRRSAYNYVANRNAHCALHVSEQDCWIVTTERSDVWTEYATGRQFTRVPVGDPVRLDNGMRLRLGGSLGLEIGIVLV